MRTTSKRNALFAKLALLFLAALTVVNAIPTFCFLILWGGWLALCARDALDFVGGVALLLAAIIVGYLARKWMDYLQRRMKALS